jgi:hypothetical protein
VLCALLDDLIRADENGRRDREAARTSSAARWAGSCLPGGGNCRLDIVETPHLQDLYVQTQGPSGGLGGTQAGRGFPRIVQEGDAGELRYDLSEKFQSFCERCLDLCRTWQFADRTPFVAATLGTAYALAGRADEALPMVANAVEEFHWLAPAEAALRELA